MFTGYAYSVIASLGEAIQSDASLKIRAGLLHFVRNDDVFLYGSHRMRYVVFFYGIVWVKTRGQATGHRSRAGRGQSGVRFILYKEERVSPFRLCYGRAVKVKSDVSLKNSAKLSFISSNLPLVNSRPRASTNFVSSVGSGV